MFFVAEGVDITIITVMEFFLGKFPQAVVFKRGEWGFLDCLASTGFEVCAASQEVKKSCFFPQIYEFSEKHTTIHQVITFIRWAKPTLHYGEVE